MTKPKKADRPFCKIQPHAADGRVMVTVEWLDAGKERVATRITNALKSEGYEARTARSRKESGERLCLLVTSAPIELVQRIARSYFLNIQVKPETSAMEQYAIFARKLGSDTE